MDERIYLSKDRLLEIEDQIRIARHVSRYALLRQYVYGNVVDIACGCGYGSYLLAGNPDAAHVTGVDAGADAISHAREHFAHPKITFQEGTIESFCADRRVDLVVSVETLEHLRDVSVFANFLERNDVPKCILTYPSKKTTHYNKHHFHDLDLELVKSLVPQYALERHFNWEHEFDVCFLTRR